MQNCWIGHNSDFLNPNRVEQMIYIIFIFIIQIYYTNFIIQIFIIQII